MPASTLDPLTPAPASVQPPLATLLARARTGDRAALARVITRVEAGGEEALELVRGLHARRWAAPGWPHVVGLTGPPGAGKSTFTDQLVRLARARGERVAVVAVDPSSPRSGGAILGDRIRMEEHAGDDGVYVRSLSARGAGGGLSRATGQIVDVLDAVGFDRILVETVGVGQGELAVLGVADTVLVVLTPESGDTVQTMKAGLLEIADVFCVNKADRPGADALARDLEFSVHLDSPALGAPGIAAPAVWAAPVHTASALLGKGVAEVLESVEAHRRWLSTDGRASWDERRADGRVATWLELCAEAARSRGARSPRIADLRAGRVRPEDLPREREG